jgi:hypothetical protein
MLCAPLQDLLQDGFIDLMEVNEIS